MIQVNNRGARDAEILLYGEISPNGEISAANFAAVLESFGSIDNLVVGINSPGGDVFEGVAIHTRLASFRGNITTRVDGLAASAASYILMAGHTILCDPAAMVMIHNAWSGCFGNAMQMRHIAGVLDKIDAQLVTAYAKRTGISRPQIAEMMKDETWMTAKEALDHNFIDGISKQPSYPTMAKVAQGRFKNTPRWLHEGETMREMYQRRQNELVASLSTSTKLALIQAKNNEILQRLSK